MIADFLLRPELWGLVLIAISALTLLSLLTDNRSSFIDRWIRFLNEMVGLGVWGVPLVAGALGLWVVIRAVEQMPDLPWQRPAGLTALFLAFITGAALVVTSTPAHAGGVIGSAIAAGLQSSLGVIGAWSVVSLIVVLGSVLLTDQLLMHAAVDLWYRWHDWRRERMERRRSPIQPVLPIPSGTLPWWKRLKERFTGNRQKELPPNMVPANPPRVISEPLRRTPVTERPAPTPPSPAPCAGLS